MNDKLQDMQKQFDRLSIPEILDFLDYVYSRFLDYGVKFHYQLDNTKLKDIGDAQNAEIDSID